MFPGIGRAPIDLGRLLGDPVPTLPVVGLEHEYTVRHGRDSRQLDFAYVVHELRLGRPHLDPDDPNAYRLPSGAVVTADKREAEIALPPIEARPGFARRIATAADRERRALAERLGEATLTGYSTHLSVEVPEGLEVDTGRLYVNRFGPAMLLAMDGPDAPGLRIRPRHGRLELCGDFLDGERLEDAVELAAGSVARCVAALSAGADRGASLPPTIRARWLPAIERRGWFIDRRLLGLDGSAGERGSFELVDNGHIAAAEQIEAARVIAREALAGGNHAAGALGIALGAEAYGDVLRARHRRGVELAPVMVTWPLTVFVAAGADRGAPGFVVVPRRWLRSFLAKLDGGELDATLRRFIGGRRDGQPGSWRDVSRPGLFGALGSRLALLPPEPM